MIACIGQSSSYEINSKANSFGELIYHGDLWLAIGIDRQIDGCSEEDQLPNVVLCLTGVWAKIVDRSKIGGFCDEGTPFTTR